MIINDKNFNLTVTYVYSEGIYQFRHIYIYIGVQVFRLSNSLQNFTCIFSNMSIISASAKRWSGGVEWSGVLETPNIYICNS
jgi:hypothetical protein